MKKTVSKIIAVLLGLSFVFPLVACGNTDEGQDNYFYYDDYFYFNTQTRWVFAPAEGKEAGEKDKATWNAITSVLARVENSVSVEISTSSISKFNAAAADAKVEIDETAFEILELAQDLYEKTDGAYNPAVGMLVDLWGFSPRCSSGYTPEFPYDREIQHGDSGDSGYSTNYLPLPSEEYIQAFLTLSDFSQVELQEEDGTYYAIKPASAQAIIEGETYTMQLNLGGIGKGYAVDEAVKIIREAGYQTGYLSLGGSSICVLGEMSVGVINPRQSALGSTYDFITVNAAKGSLSSSGDYQQYYTVAGKRYSHIVNPETGYPVNCEPEGNGSGIICASVFDVSAAEGDATTTALMVMGKERATEYIRTKLPASRACFVYYDAAENSYTLYTNMEEDEYTRNVEIKVETI